MWFLAGALLTLVTSHALGANVLVVHILPVYSHTVPFRPVFEELGRRGHNITIITPFTGVVEETRLTEIRSNLTTKLAIELLIEKIGPFVDDFHGLYYEMNGMTPFCATYADILATYLKPFLPPPSSKFDLLVLEPFFCQEWTLGLSHYYQAPVVATLPQPLTPFISDVLGNPILSSYVPNFRLALTAEMGFLERVKNTLVEWYEVAWAHYQHYPKMDKVMRSLLERDDLPHLSELLSNVALILSGSHFSLDYHRPQHRNVVQVGALTIGMPKEIPEDVEAFVKEAEDGVIYFSWGSHYEPVDPEPIVAALMKTFSKLKQRVIFKWHQTNITNLPSNVLIKKWVPQTELLKNEKLKLFISHCGLNSVNEAVYFGVPVIGNPQFGDQFHNSKLLEYFGIGLTVTNQQILDGTSLYKAIQTIVTTPSFRENAQKRMRMMRDRPMSGVDEAAYWIEYVLRHGASSLKPASMYMRWYQLALIDVYLFIFTVLFVSLFTVAYILRRFFSQPPLDRLKKDN